MGRISSVGIPRAGVVATIAAAAAFVVGAGEPGAWGPGAREAGFLPAGGTIVGVATTKEAAAAFDSRDDRSCDLRLGSRRVRDGGRRRPARERRCLSSRREGEPGGRSHVREREVPVRATRRTDAPRRRRQDGEPRRNAAHDARRSSGWPGLFQHQPSRAEHDPVAASGQGRAGHSFLQHPHMDARIHTGD